jgi:energy-coupling factor transporter ATP-binding protein EcfA2
LKYNELIRFDPIESVIQLRDADHADEARRLVSSFVASNSMIEQLSGVVFPNLQFAEQYDRKGLLIVGNYGTGKSHLMAVITGICENSSLVAELRNQKLKDATGSVAGRFKVIRAEIGAVTMPLRDIVIRELERGLTKFGIDYHFPLPSETTGYKEPIIEMMQKFSELFPEQGLIFALDELLDYLRGRDEQALINDLIFLRELGEVCARSRFRFIAGIQEALFDNPHFHFVSQSILKVRDRYQEIHIVRTDIEYVVAERLLRKNAKQKALVREHLEKFAPLYPGMSESMEHFVGLFPVHPSFIETFERISFAEKREVLKSISLLIRKLLETEVPLESTGLISFDSYWDILKGTQSFRAVPSIGEVVEKSERLEALVVQNLPRTHYKPIALRIIYALSIHRLTTGDINNPLGLTTEQLRDQLCLGFPAVVPSGQATSDFLNSNVEMVVQQIVKTVSGQYISYNVDNRQYYLDLKKDIDYDQLIRDKAESK